ncbi:ribonuclease P protein component [Chthonobacter albigriseus]|uniref:ribonuclease P protein component n=1 Tax=Chthonobacter albigriseus TaxID=1683161 RepID=UPI0015EF3721|nr:ribonuclease P protein component [Chthonobacter albigriseus]
MKRLTKRSEYTKVARGQRTPRRGFLLQSLDRDRSGSEPAPARFGFTVTKKTGNAVVRNRIRRRLKEAVRLHGALVAKPGTDYVLIGRPPALGQPFQDLVADVVGALKSSARPRGKTDDDRSRREQKRPVDG